jgi:FkbM family methyltransferase
MRIFSEVIKPGTNVLEIGGHIGYLTTYYSYLVGPSGKVVVFEPGRNNLKYLYRNVKNLNAGNIIIEELAAGNQNCTMDFYLDPITGQNNTLVKSFEGFEKNREYSAEPNTQYTVDSVTVVRLDDYLKYKDLPDFIKIDIEGYEWECIEGFKATIENKRPILMIEIQANQEKIINYFKSLNYKIYNDTMGGIFGLKDFENIGTPNIFFFP